MIASRILTFLAACILIPTVLSDFNNRIEIESDAESDHMPFPFVINNEDVLKKLIDAYRRNIDLRLVTESDSPPEKLNYQVWKRNADIINTLLGFPRRMIVAGR